MQAISVNDGDYSALKEQYAIIVSTWPTLNLDAQPPTLEQWIAANTIVGRDRTAATADLADIRLFNAIEKLVTNLRLHNFSLTHIDTIGKKYTDSSLGLSEVLVAEFKLPPQYVMRLRALFDYYQKSLTETANAEHLGLTATASESMIEAFHRFIARTIEAIHDDEVKVERAVGRIEGAAALLVRANVMTRERAAAETDEFKKNARKK